jgi:hypothetical protein
MKYVADNVIEKSTSTGVLVSLVGVPEKVEVGITPEMIEAGVMALISYNPDIEVPDEAVIRVFLAMFRLKG